MKIHVALGIICIFGVALFAQSEDAYSTGEDHQNTGNSTLIDPSRLSIHHSLSFGAASISGLSDMKSQSLYSTMLQYRFQAPVTLNLNFGLPIHSTFSSTQNLTTDNLQSLDYFKSMPFDLSLTWQPSEKMLMRLSFVRETTNSFFFDRNYPGYLDRLERREP